MSPELRAAVVQRRLHEMRRLLDLLARHQDLTGASLEADLERRLAVERALQQVVDLAVRINAHVVASEDRPPPADYYSTFAAAADVGLIERDLATALAPSTGMRNRLVHEYDDIDLDAVARSIPIAVEQYGRYVRQVAAFLLDSEEPGASPLSG